MERKELNKIFIQVINKAFNDAKEKDAVPGFDLKEMIPDFRKIMKCKDNVDLKALSYLLQSWADAINHDLSKLWFGKKISIVEAEELILIAKRVLEEGGIITDARILEYGKH